MKAKIRVHGKSQSRTVLGIINAYLKLFPDTTLPELRQAFPGSLNPKSFTDSLFVPVNETKGNEKQFFEREDEQVILKSGRKLAMVEVWAKEEYDAMLEHAKQYGIVVADMDLTKPFEKGSYELEYLDGFGVADEIAAGLAAATIPTPVVDIPPAPEVNIPPAPAVDIPDPEYDGKLKCKWLWWILLAFLLLALLAFLMNKCCGSKTCEIKTPEIELALPTVVNPWESIKGELDPHTNNFIYDVGEITPITLPDGTICHVGLNSSECKLFNFLSSDDMKVNMEDKTQGWITLDRILFETGHANLTPESENQLNNIAMLMKLFPNSHIKLGGYTDNTGTDEINMRLSEERAKVTAEKLVALGVDASRLAHEGYGSQHPVCPPNDTDQCRALNRRIDVRVTQK